MSKCQCWVCTAPDDVFKQKIKEYMDTNPEIKEAIDKLQVEIDTLLHIPVSDLQ